MDGACVPESRYHGSVREKFPGWLLDLPGDLVAVGADLEVDTLIEAYTKGIFPWNGDDPIRWYSPNPRMILVPEEVHVSRSLKKVIERGELRVEYDRDFRRVMTECMSVPRPGQVGTWITPRMIDAYEKLHRLGIAHSVETRLGDELAGGLYGLTFGGAFFGESMFARRPDASKVALVQLCRDLAVRGFDFIDCQQVTPHLARMGAVPIPRKKYLERLARALEKPSIHRSWSGGP
jgi:leucyl/phenylalanyl-tRNA---protein transferase